MKISLRIECAKAYPPHGTPHTSYKCESSKTSCAVRIEGVTLGERASLISNCGDSYCRIHSHYFSQPRLARDNFHGSRIGLWLARPKPLKLVHVHRNVVDLVLFLCAISIARLNASTAFGQSEFLNRNWPSYHAPRKNQDSRQWLAASPQWLHQTCQHESIRCRGYSKSGQLLASRCALLLIFQRHPKATRVAIKSTNDPLTTVGTSSAQ